MNTIYTILVNGIDVEGERYARRMDPTLEFSSDQVLADILVKPSSDPGYTAFQANLLCELCSVSSYSEELVELDPCNTYGNRIPPPLESFSAVGQPSSVKVHVVDGSGTYPWTTARFCVTVDVDSDKAVMAVSGGSSTEITLSTVGGVSRVLEVKDGLGIWLGGLRPGDRFTIVAEAIRKPSRDMAVLLTSLVELEGAVPDGVSTVDYIAKKVLDHCREALAG